MRFAVTYQVECIPIHYRMKVYSLLKEAVKRADANYYEEIFVGQRREPKPFSFATYLKDFQMKKDKIHLQEMTITVSALMEFAVHAFNGLRKIKQYEIEGVTWTQTNIRLLNEATISTGRVYFKTLSPILIEDKNGQPLSPADENYEKELNYYANLLVQRISARPLYKPLKFEPIHMKKNVVKESNRLFAKTNDQSSLYFTTYSGLFKLEGHPEDLQLLYQLGIGKRTTYFGLPEYVREEV